MHSRARSRPVRLWLRHARAHWRDSLLLVKQFGWPLALFALVVVGGGSLYYLLAGLAGEPVDDLVEAVYLTLGLTFLQSSGEFPHTWYLEAFYFFLPVIGIGLLAQGVADFGVAFFNRRTRSKEWEMAIASTFNQHIVLIGLGHLGYRVVENLNDLDQDLVVIEQNPAADLVANVRALGIPVLQEDGRRETTLTAAGIERARAVIVCTQNDSQNLQMALKARKLNPSLQVVVRIFDDDFAQSLQEQFGFVALSATGMAAPAFAAAAAGVEITRPIAVDGQPLSLARLTVHATAPLSQMTVADVEKLYDVSLVLLRRDGQADFHPLGTRRLETGDLLVVLAGPQQLNSLIQENCNNGA